MTDINFSMATVRSTVTTAREHDAQASKGWRHTHSTIVRDADQKVVANMWTFRSPRTPGDLINTRPGSAQSYLGWETDPIHELPDARAIVFGRKMLPRFADMLEGLAKLVDDLSKYANHVSGCAGGDGSSQCQCGYAEVWTRLTRLNRRR